MQNAILHAWRISSIEDLEENYKAKINTSNYEKGKVAWDGYSRKALVEVIPGYLSKIYNALTEK